ncbi:unnamed protein product [Ectocarpus sp. 12 AP-2014]
MPGLAQAARRSSSIDSRSFFSAAFHMAFHQHYRPRPCLRRPPKVQRCTAHGPWKKPGGEESSGDHSSRLHRPLSGEAYMMLVPNFGSEMGRGDCMSPDHADSGLLQPLGAPWRPSLPPALP